MFQTLKATENTFKSLFFMLVAVVVPVFLIAFKQNILSLKLQSIETTGYNSLSASAPVLFQTEILQT